MPSTLECPVEGREVFENFREIKHAKEVKSLIRDILTVEEDQRITAAQILEKYAGWFDAFN